MKLEYDSKIRKGKLVYPERIIERSLGKVPPSKDLIDKHLQERGNMYRTSLMLAAIFSVIGIVGIILKIINGFDNLSDWSVYVTACVFIFTTFMGAPMLSMATKVARGNWRRPVSRLSEIFCISGIAGLLMFLPMLWVLPGLEDGRNTLWFYDPGKVPAYSPHIWTSIAMIAFILTALALLWINARPDFAILRDNSKGKNKIYSTLAWGWVGSTRQWNSLRQRLSILGIFYFMLLVTVHFCLASDFLMTLIPGWVDSLYPATQAHNAIQGGVAILIIAVFIAWKWGGYQEYLGLDQFWGLGKLLFGISLLWVWFFISSLMVLWYGKKPNERDVLQILMFGKYLPVFLGTIFFVFIVPFAILMLNNVRKSFYGPPIIAISVLIGNFLDRYRHYSSAYSLDRSIDENTHRFANLPEIFVPSIVDMMVILGAIAIPVFIILFITKYVPIISLWENREYILYGSHEKYHHTEVLVEGKPY